MGGQHTRCSVNLRKLGEHTKAIDEKGMKMSCIVAQTDNGTVLITERWPSDPPLGGSNRPLMGDPERLGTTVNPTVA